MNTRAVTDIDVLGITLEIDSKEALFILLGKDGTVNRMGSGSPSTADGALFIGVTQPPVFRAAIKGLPEKMLNFTGTRLTALDAWT